MSKALPWAIHYHRWVYQQVEPYLGRRILDIGGGTGNHVSFLLERERLVVVDAAEDCLAVLTATYGAQPNLRVVRGDICDPAVVTIGLEERIDSITCFNVLEHIAEDRAALHSMRTILAPRRGRLLLLVPALKALQGTMDDTAGHYRRYDKAGLRELLADCGFLVQDIFYMNAFGAIGWFLNSRVLKQRNLSADTVSVQILLFDRLIVPIISRVERWVRPAFGQSLIAIAQA